MNKISAIYAIIHKETNRMYIGSAVHLHRRWAVHRNRLRSGVHHSLRLQNAWNKYGEDAFSFMIVQEVEPCGLIEWEQFWLDKMKPHFNIALIARSCLGVKKSPESVEKTTAKIRGLKRSEEQRAAMSARMKGRKLSEETRRKISEIQMGKKLSPEWIEKCIAPLRGRKRSIEECAAISKGKSHRVWKFTNPYGERVDIVNLAAFCKQNGLSQGNMWKVYNNLQTNHKGWRKTNDDGDHARGTDTWDGQKEGALRNDLHVR